MTIPPEIYLLGACSGVVSVLMLMFIIFKELSVKTRKSSAFLLIFSSAWAIATLYATISNFVSYFGC